MSSLSGQFVEYQKCGGPPQQTERFTFGRIQYNTLRIKLDRFKIISHVPSVRLFSKKAVNSRLRNRIDSSRIILYSGSACTYYVGAKFVWRLSRRYKTSGPRPRSGAESIGAIGACSEAERSRAKRHVTSLPFEETASPLPVHSHFYGAFPCTVQIGFST